MPVLSFGHSHYWQGTSAADPPAPELGGGTAGGYVPFQRAVILGNCAAFGLGSAQVVYDWLKARQAARKAKA